LRRAEQVFVSRRVTTEVPATASSVADAVAEDEAAIEKVVTDIPTHIDDVSILEGSSSQY
jgi:hypothetical protein